MSNRDEAMVALQISAQIKPMLAGHPPQVQAAVLADLVSIWLAGHASGGPAFLDGLLADFIKTVRALVPASVAEIERRSTERRAP